MDLISRREKEKRIHENDILDAAEKIFIATGFENASMDEIAREAQFTRKTIYQYFSNKKDLYVAVVTRGFKLLYSRIVEEEKQGKNGFEKLQKMGIAYYFFYKDNPDTFLLMSLIGRIKTNDEDTIYNREFNNINISIKQEVAKIIEEGKSDGSVRDDLDTKMLMFSAQFLMTGFFYELSLAGKTFTEHFSINQGEFIDFILKMLFDTFRKE